jgi:hypothetical protein
MSMPELKVTILEFVDPRFPGWVAAEFVDAEGRTHRIVDKVPLFTERMLDAESRYPQEGSTECIVVGRWRDVQGRDVLKIRCLASSNGDEEYIVLGSHLVGAP